MFKGIITDELPGVSSILLLLLNAVRGIIMALVGLHPNIL